VTDLLLRVPAEEHRAFGGPKRYALGPMIEVLVAPLTRTTLGDAVPVSQVTWTSAQHIAADVPERH
jgi:LDH2 family malate/lactate/ureidoglycolate dehydrogenase